MSLKVHALWVTRTTPSQLKNQNRKNNKMEEKRIWNKEVLDFRKLIRITGIEVEAKHLLKKREQILKRKLYGKVK